MCYNFVYVSQNYRGRVSRVWFVVQTSGGGRGTGLGQEGAHVALQQETPESGNFHFN